MLRLRLLPSALGLRTLCAAALLLGACGDEGPREPASPLRDPARLKVLETRAGEAVLRAQLYPLPPPDGAPIQLLLELEAPSTWPEARWEAGTNAGHLRVRERRATANVVEDGLRRMRWEARLEAPRAGRLLGRLAPVQIPASEGRESLALQLGTFELEVAALVDEGGTTGAELPRALGPIELPDRRRPHPAVWIAGAALLVSAGAFGAWRALRRPPAPVEPTLDPRAEALAALAALRARRLEVEAAFAELFYELTRIVRVFLERTTGVHAAEQTTEEFLHHAERHPSFPGSLRGELRSFLEAADLVKYAAQVPAAGHVEASYAAAERVITRELDAQRSTAEEPQR